MNFIVYDIEATCWETPPPNMVQETIEIGAVKVNSYGEVLDIFERFIRPELYPMLSPFCQELTTIQQPTINRARPFPEVIEDFKEWSGILDGEDYLLCSWGSFDKKILVQDCEFHDLDADWVEQHINVRRQYHDLKRWRSYKGLKKVVELEGYEFTGTYHRGVSDAKNLTKIFTKYIDEWQY